MNQFSANYGGGIAWNGYMWVACGYGAYSILYSYDGINWNIDATNQFNTGGYGVAWNGRMWVAVGQGTYRILYSYDGINWNTDATNQFDGNYGLGIAYSSNVGPLLKINNLEIPNNQNIPIFLRSTNTIAESFNSIVLNNTLSVYGYPQATNNTISSCVGINNTNPQYTLDVNGTINANLGVFSNGTALTSDRRVKQNIISADLSLCYTTIRDIPLRRFEFVSSISGTKTDKKQLGFIADELSSIFPKSVHENSLKFGKFSTILFVNLEQVQMAHFGATQQLMKIVEQQQSTINGQQLMYQTLFTQVSQLFSTIQR